MARKNPKKRGGSRISQFTLPVPGEAIDEIERLLDEGRSEDAIDFIEYWREKRPNHPVLAFYLGSAYLMLQEPEMALAPLRLACRVDPKNEGALYNLFYAYLELDFPTHGLRALKKYLRTEMAREEADPAKLSALRAELEQHHRETALHLGVPLEVYEEAAWWNEEGQIAQLEGNWEEAIACLNRALGGSPDFAAALNNRAMIYYFMGRLEEAIADEERVVEKMPENIHALANLVRFHYVRGELPQAQDRFARLRALPETAWEHQSEPIHKLLEAYAVAGTDEEIHAFLEQHREALPERGRYMLGAAAANLGKRDEARQCWEQVEEDGQEWADLAEGSLQCLNDGLPGTGRADRFPYTSFSEWLDPEPLGDMMEVLEEAVDDPEGQRQMMRAYANQHPAVFEVARWLLWHGEDPLSAIYLLSSLGTERAVAELKRFALGQAGEDEERMRAAMELNNQGLFPEGQPVRLWHRGEWRDLLLKKFEITDESEEPEYSPEVHRLLGEAAAAVQEQRFDQAEELCHRALALDPGCRMAYSVLAKIFSHRGDTPGMARQFEKALEIDPDYATARCGLALLYLEAGKVEEAEELIAPLLERQQFSRSELVAYNVAMARIQLHRGNLEAVEAALDVLFELAPDDPLVLQLEQTLAEHREKG